MLDHGLDRLAAGVVQARELRFAGLGEREEVFPPVSPRLRALHKPALHETVEDAAQVALIDCYRAHDLPRSAVARVLDLVQHAHLGEGVGAVQDVVVDKPDDVRVEPVELPYGIDVV